METRITLNQFMRTLIAKLKEQNIDPHTAVNHIDYQGEQGENFEVILDTETNEVSIR